MAEPFYYLLMSQKDFLQNQVMEEILRERANFYFNQKKNKDFWILIQPNFVNNKELKSKIQKSNFYKQQKNNLYTNLTDTEFFVALVSINKEFIKWVELRIGAFEDIDLIQTQLDQDYTSNGIKGRISSSSVKNILTSVEDSLHPSLLVNKYEQSLKYFYSV